MSSVPKTKTNQNRCICGNCPTYQSNQCLKNESKSLFCAIGKVNCSLIKKGCICGACPVQTENWLNNHYYCKE